jgi:hypothetical protein
MLQEHDFYTRVVGKDANQFRATVSPEPDDANSAPFIFIHNNE